jgi:hypothetical protein
MAPSFAILSINYFSNLEMAVAMEPNNNPRQSKLLNCQMRLFEYFPWVGQRKALRKNDDGGDCFVRFKLASHHVVKSRVPFIF